MLWTVASYKMIVLQLKKKGCEADIDMKSLSQLQVVSHQ